MKYPIPLLVAIFTLAGSNCAKKNVNKGNIPPVAALESNLVAVSPFTYEFTVTASDQEFDPLTYTWNFGEGTIRTGNAKERFSYPAAGTYIVSVSVTDGKSAPVELKDTLIPRAYTLTMDDSKKFQVMEGFGGFGSQREGWSGGPFTSDAFVETMMDDLGISILRMNVPTNFEQDNDNDDPFVTDLAGFNINNNTPGHDEKLADHIPYLIAMKEKGLKILIASIWSPPVWMKHNNRVNNVNEKNEAPPYTHTPDGNTNQLRTDMYDEFAECCVAYIKIIKQTTGLDVYALSIQNEPRFSQFYASCVYNGEALRDLIKVVGKRFRDEHIATRLFLPEDVGWYDGIRQLVDPVLADPEARQYVDILAVHGYANDGVLPGSADAVTWKNMYDWGAPYNIPLWMTETSGYENTLDGAIALSRAMYIALKYGNASAWVFWTMSTTQLDAYSLMNANGVKSKRYYISKNFFRYIRPGAQRFQIESDNEHILPLAFHHEEHGVSTIIVINTDDSGKPFNLSGTGLKDNYNAYITNETKDCESTGEVSSNDVILIPARSVLTLQHTN
ncbi:MAG: PKD domain-containing protein [Chitinophagaceae bacterium]|nr:PKD domain-containing protein [Chitinophagaceae bacterium]MCW5927680.1 PKD domain-containing protein [Chitinophagaceae bacterium]